MSEFTAYFAIWWALGTLIYFGQALLEKHRDGEIWLVVYQLIGPIAFIPLLWAILDDLAKARRGE